MTDIITQLLKGFLSQFKIKSPKVWVMVLFALGMLNYSLNTAAVTGVFGAPNQFWVDALKWISFAYAIVSSTETTPSVKTNPNP